MYILYTHANACVATRGSRRGKGSPAGQHMRQHRENEKIVRIRSFCRNFDFFPEAQDHLKLCFIVFFDVLEL